MWFDTGALGATIPYGRVISAGPKVYRVRWESGLTNRLIQDHPGIDIVGAGEVTDAIAAMRRVEEYGA